MQFVIYALIYLGSALMVFNIVSFIRYAKRISAGEDWGKSKWFLIVPNLLLILFLAGYLAVGIFGEPDLIISGILFGGSIFVTVMYFMLNGITVRLAKHQEIAAELKAAEESRRAKNAFLSDVSHEMRTPLNVIIGLDALALKDPDLHPDTRQHLEKIERSSQHLLVLINNVLDFSSIETGEFAAKNVEFSMKDVLDTLCAVAEISCGSKGLEFRTDIPEDVFGRYVGDEMRLEQTVVTLLDKAVEYTESGYVELSVRTDPGSQKPVVTFSVKDTGRGIAPELLPNFFERVASEETLGNGLAAMKMIAEHIGGTVSVDSVLGEGSVFSISVPMEKVSGSDGREGGEVSLAGKRILIVEDVPDNAEIVSDLLELEGMESDWAENGKAGVEKFASSPEGTYDAVLMDLRMPVMDGLTAAREIRKLDREDAKTVPILALTANALESDVRETEKAGMNAHLSKPADAETLYSALKKYIRT